MSDTHKEAMLGGGGSSSGSTVTIPQPTTTGDNYPSYPGMSTAGISYPTAPGTIGTGVPTTHVQLAAGSAGLVPVPPQACQQQYPQLTSAQRPRKSLIVAYILWTLFGIFGAHHFYLRRYFFGIIYASTLGLFGCGWVIDFFRLPCLVNETNQEQNDLLVRYDATLTTNQINNRYFMRDRSLADAYVLWFPLGIFGFHHFYLGRIGFGVIYSFTLGLGGVGWLVDFCRIPSLVQETNDKLRRLRNGEMVERTLECSVADAYQLAFPLGMLGLHHFYMGRVGQGFVYLFTLGLGGIGWLVDLIRLPYLVARHNKEVQQHQTWLRHLDDAYIYAVPFGILGFHRFYLNGPLMGLLYFFTAGLFLLGWLTDLVRMPWLVMAANEKEARRQELIGNDRVYVFQAAGNPVLIPSNYGAIYPPVPPEPPEPPYPAQQNTHYVPYYNFPNNQSDQNFAMPPPVSPNTCPPENPPPYSMDASQQPACPPSYQQSSNQACNPSAPLLQPEQKPLC
ncbi:uncharacterized protein LOC117288580 [Asterias rubens]|uniref:uncharacterized protein LOC117288580 n=1 Tax=Asterias rubens TaxID=7604 RepID=UPI001454F4F8|nr:uncharacterized protein LOC117288580 [Asterias rubens]